MIDLSPNVRIFADTIEDAAIKQIRSLSEYEAYKDNRIRIMPDVHAGKGCTIGTTMKITGKITPNLVGVDIGCGVLVIRLKNPITDFESFDRHLRSVVPSGFDVHDKPVCNVEAEIRHLKELFCPFDMEYTLRSIGTLGGGNHFVEVDIDKSGNQYLVIHSGSRNLGVKVANYYQKFAIKQCSKPKDINEIITRLHLEGRQREIEETIKSLKSPNVSKELAYLSENAFWEYIHDMRICQDYATLNRMTIADLILGSKDWRRDYFCTIHNYIDIDEMILRKGAVSAKKGETFIVPINMRDGSLICVGKGNEDWNYSAPHGAGRLMSRKKAKKSLSMDEYKDSMRDIFTTSVSFGTIDEAPMAYKPIKEIVKCIEDTATIVDIIKPIYNFKASESGN